MNHIDLDRVAVDHALELLRQRRAVETYSWLQAELHGRDVSCNSDYQRTFNGFYRVRRNAAWREIYFGILERGKAQLESLDDVLRTLHGATGRVEASFATKLIATLDPWQPVIDSVVLGNLGLKLRLAGDIHQRVAETIKLHADLAQTFSSYLNSKGGHLFVQRFHDVFPAAELTEVKMLDLVPWQLGRPNHAAAVGRGVVQSPS